MLMRWHFVAPRLPQPDDSFYGIQTNPWLHPSLKFMKSRGLVGCFVRDGKRSTIGDAAFLGASKLGKHVRTARTPICVLILPFYANRATHHSLPLYGMPLGRVTKFAACARPEFLYVVLAYDFTSSNESGLIRS